MAKFKKVVAVDFDVKFLKVKASVRYWEDADVNDVEDVDGNLIPFREGDCWCPIIDIDTGVVVGWPVDTNASIHYKVCDCGEYSLLTEEKETVASIEGYVPRIMCPKENGYGDYIIMDIDGTGKISDWDCNLDDFNEEQ